MKKVMSILCLVVLTVCSFTNIAFAQETDVSEILTVSNELPANVNAKACILMDVNTGTVLAGKNENEKLFPASVTKIMSLLLIFEAIEQGKLTYETKISCSETAAEKGGSQIWLEPGESMTVDELLKAVVVYSANDACCLLGEAVAGSEAEFCARMNERAKELGMNNTNFMNCTGLDDNIDDHKTTAYDIALMSRALLQQGDVKKYTCIWMDTLRNGQTQLVNTNKLIRTYPGATGLKTGTTSKAGCCVSASAERDGLELIAVVLGADNSKDRFASATGLLDYGFAAYEIFSPSVEGKYPSTVKVNNGVEEYVELNNTACTDILIDKGKSSEIEYVVECEEELTAPVTKGQCIGKLMYKIGDNVLGSIDIVTDREIEQKTVGNAFKALFYSFCANIK